MDLFGIKKIEKRILEIKRILNDENRLKEIGKGITTEVAERILRNQNKPLIAELEELQTVRGFAHDRRNLVVNVSTILVSLLIAISGPYLAINVQKEYSQKTEIQAMYQAVTANEDIYISNFNAFRYARNKGLPVPVPEQYINISLADDTISKLKEALGIDLYRYLLHYLNWTNILREQNTKLNEQMIKDGPLTFNNKNVQQYEAILVPLESEKWMETKYNYIYDNSCLAYILKKTFSFIEPSDRDTGKACSQDSLNRIYYHYGYIEAEMPRWIRPELRAALNAREKGLGDRLIND